MHPATVEDAIAYTPEADGEPEIKIRSFLEDASREVEKIAPTRPPIESLLTEDISPTSTSLKIGPVRTIPYLSSRLLSVTAASYPDSGVLRIGDEDIAYGYRDVDTQTFYDLTRGHGRTSDSVTTASAHLAGDKVIDHGYEYAFFYAQLKVFDYLWKTGGAITAQFSNQAVGAQGTFNSLGAIRAIVRNTMGEYAIGARPAKIVSR